MKPDDLTPAQLLAISGAYWQSCALHAAVKLGLFTALRDERLDVTEVTRRLGTDPRGTRLLLNALAAMQLLEKNDGRFSNSPAAAAWLVESAPGYLGHSVLHHHNLMPSWSRLDQAVRMGAPTRDRVATDSETIESFQRAMCNSASVVAAQLPAQIDLSPCRLLLDLGGGPGTHACAFCRHNPQLQAVVFDLPTSRPFFEETARKFGVENRVDFFPGDFHADPLPAGYDVAWLSQILHAESPADCFRLIQKTVETLAPGGVLMIHEFFLTDTEDGPLFPALFALNMLAGTEGGQSYSESQVREWMRAAGLKEIHRLEFRGPNDSGILAGTK